MGRCKDDVGMCEKLLFDFSGVDILSSSPDDFLHTIQEEHIAVLIHLGKVSRMQPLTLQRGQRTVRVVEVSREELIGLVTPNQKMPSRVDWQWATLIICNADSAPFRGSPTKARHQVPPLEDWKTCLYTAIQCDELMARTRLIIASKGWMQRDSPG